MVKKKKFMYSWSYKNLVMNLYVLYLRLYFDELELMVSDCLDLMWRLRNFLLDVKSLISLPWEKRWLADKVKTC